MNQQSRPPRWSEPGYSSEELDHAQERWALEFPPDLIDFLRARRPYCTGDGFFDWVHSPDAEIQQLLSWPFNGFWFDVQHNGVWWADWGRKPETPARQMALLKEIFRGAPRLIPVYGRRFIPATPSEPGNPIFSVYQTDVICFGHDLDHWMRIEFEGAAPPAHGSEKQVTFWSQAIRENERRFAKV